MCFMRRLARTGSVVVAMQSVLILGSISEPLIKHWWTRGSQDPEHAYGTIVETVSNSSRICAGFKWVSWSIPAASLFSIGSFRRTGQGTQPPTGRVSRLCCDAILNEVEKRYWKPGSLSAGYTPRKQCETPSVWGAMATDDYETRIKIHTSTGQHIPGMMSHRTTNDVHVHEYNS